MTSSQIGLWLSHLPGIGNIPIIYHILHCSQIVLCMRQPVSLNSYNKCTRNWIRRRNIEFGYSAEEFAGREILWDSEISKMRIRGGRIRSGRNWNGGRGLGFCKRHCREHFCSDYYLARSQPLYKNSEITKNGLGRIGVRPGRMTSISAELLEARDRSE